MHEAKKFTAKIKKQKHLNKNNLKKERKIKMNNTNTNNNKITVLGEIAEARTENSKTYAMSDGSFQTVYSLNETISENPGIMTLSAGNEAPPVASMTTYSWAKGNMFTSATHKVGITTESSGYTENRMYLNFTLPTLPRNPRIKNARLELKQNSSSFTAPLAIGLYKVTSDISIGSCTPSVSSYPIDYEMMRANPEKEKAVYTFDVTAYIDDIYSGNDTYKGFMLKFIEENPGTEDHVTFYGTSDTTYSPKIIINYESSYATESLYRTHTHELGRFGQGNVDLACGNLTFNCPDFAWGGKRMPVTIIHNYNSALYDKQYSDSINTSSFAAMKIGKGWKLNYMQSMLPEEFYHEGKMVNGYIFRNEDNDEFRFITGSNINNKYIAIDNEDMEYDSGTKVLNYGEEKYGFDDKGRLVYIQSIEYPQNLIHISYENERIGTISDGAGRSFSFVYNESGYLTTITAPDNSEINYGYDSSGYLTRIIYPDNTKAIIGYYMGDVRTVSLTDSNGNSLYRIRYVITNNRVTTVTEQAYENGGYVNGTSTTYVYSAASNQTKVVITEPADEEGWETEASIVETVYVFNDDGEIISEYMYANGYDNMGVADEEGKITPLTGSGSTPIYNANNLLVNHRFESLDSWTAKANNSSEFVVSKNQMFSGLPHGFHHVLLNSNTQNITENGIYQTVSDLAGGEYTFSAYLKVTREFNSGSGNGVFIRVSDTSGNVIAESLPIFESDDFERVSISFNLESTQSVNAEILVNGSGAAFINSPQLENNPCACEYNYIENGCFENGVNSWSINNSNYVYSTDAKKFNMKNSLCANSRYNRECKAFQEIFVERALGTRETFVLSGWAKGTGIADREREGNENTPTFRLCANISYNDNTHEKYYADFSPCTDEWQYTEVEFFKSEYKSIEKIYVACEYSYNSGVAYFDNIQLTRSLLERELEEGDFGDISDGGDSSGYGSPDSPEFEELLDSFGNVITETTFTDGKAGTIYRSFEYDAVGNNIIRETDAMGNNSLYTVDPITSRTTISVDRMGNKSHYEYDVFDKTTKVINKDKNDTELANVSYSYDVFDNMTEIVRGDGMKYLLKYNSFHNLKGIGINGKNEDLISYKYKNGNGRLKEMSYANGDKMKAFYNDLGQMTAENWYNAEGTLIARYKYVYSSRGNIAKTIDILSLKEYNYIYQDDILLSATEYNITLGANEVITAREKVCTIRYSCDSGGNIFKKQIIFADSTVETIYYESAENSDEVVKFEIPDSRGFTDKLTVTSQSKHDSFGRKVFDELQYSTGVTNRSFSYHKGAVTTEHSETDKYKSVPTSRLVKQIVISSARPTENDRILTYEYDKEERITKITDSYSGVTEYTYDALGQLLTEVFTDNSGVSTVVNTMTYDNYGNILTKNGKVYTYDSIWKDQLVSYDGQSITYDAQGNPTTYLGHTLSWEKGRQLKSFDNISYTYNSNGIRTSKTVNGVKHEYILDGTKLLREVWGENTLIPLYDNEDSVCGIKLNGTSYFFVKNLQGDVISIVDIYGDTVVKYSYDAWGKCAVIFDNSTSFSGNLSDKLGFLNPFRYRGYYYDRETGLYYLQSRYYDPELGRFINGDDHRYLGLGKTIVAYNLNTYCENNSVNYCDYLGNSIWSFKSDWAGRKILNWYLYGRGKNRILASSKWAKYMKANKILKSKVRNLLKQYSNIKNGSTVRIAIYTSMVIENGEDIIGYQYLHGTNATVGGFYIEAFISKYKNGNTKFTCSYSWNDIIDPNFYYSSDAKKAALGKMVSFGMSQDYIIRIIWSDVSILNSSKKWISGWLKQ